MDAHKEDRNSVFQQAKGFSERRGKQYVDWLNRVLEFYRGSLDEVSEYNLKVFGN